MLERDRLDRGRVDHRRPHVPALLPHHARRPHPLRLGRRAAGGRRTAQRPHRGRRPVVEEIHRHLVDYFPALEGARSPTPGAARSTSRPATCRRSARSTTAPSTTRSGSPATASARRTWPAACWPGWLRGRRPPARLDEPGPPVPPEPLAWLGGMVVRAPSCAPSGWARDGARIPDARGVRGAARSRDPRVALRVRPSSGPGGERGSRPRPGGPRRVADARRPAYAGKAPRHRFGDRPWRPVPDAPYQPQLGLRAQDGLRSGGRGSTRVWFEIDL